MYTIWDVGAMFKASLISFLNGIKDSIIGIFYIYHLDCRLQQMHADKQKRLQEMFAARDRLTSHRRARKNSGYFLHFILSQCHCRLRFFSF